MISERPAEVEDRAVPGHWEGDLIVGANSARRSAPWSNARPATCCYCTCPTRLTRRRGGPRRRSVATRSRDRPCPSTLRRSLTWDQGIEMARHARDQASPPTADLLLRPAQALAARHQREHQRPAPPVLPQGHRPVRAHPPTTSTPSPPPSTADPARPSAGKPPPKHSTKSYSHRPSEAVLRRPVELAGIWSLAMTDGVPWATRPAGWSPNSYPFATPTGNTGQPPTTRPRPQPTRRR